MICTEPDCSWSLWGSREGDLNLGWICEAQKRGMGADCFEVRFCVGKHFTAGGTKRSVSAHGRGCVCEWLLLLGKEIGV